MTLRLEPPRHSRPFRCPHQSHLFLRFDHGPVRLPLRLSSVSLSPTFSLFPSCGRSRHPRPSAPPANQPASPPARQPASHRRGGGAQIRGRGLAGRGGRGRAAGPRAGARGGGGSRTDAARAEARAGRGRSQGRQERREQGWSAPWRQWRPSEQRGQRQAAAGSGRGFYAPWGTCCPRTWTTPGASTSQVSTAQRSARRGSGGEPPATPPSRPACWGLGRVRPRAGREWLGDQDCCPSLFLLRLSAPSRPLLRPPFPLLGGFELPPTLWSPVSSDPPTHYRSRAMGGVAASP